MPDFKVIGSVDPFLHVSLKRGEKIYAESDAMVTMDATLELKGKMQGGLMSALARRLANDESFFMQSIEAVSGEGETLLSPNIPGDVEILEVGATQYNLNDGAFLAATDGVDIQVRTQGIGQALLGGTGGFFIMQTAGHGTLAVSGFGTIFGLDITAGNDVIIDNFHVVAWDSRLNYNISASTSKSGGFLASLVSSVASGEGIVNRFSGNGKVYVCSRNRSGFLGWIASKTTKNR
ncbi:MAG: TIGR00266 family protein [Desulfuromonadaceae bacterium]